MKKLHKYQTEKVLDLYNIYGQNPRDQRAFLQMPTGTGKTFTALSFAIGSLNGKQPKTVVWVAHQLALLNQSAKDFFADFAKLGGTISADHKTGVINNVTFTFTTWQSLRSKVGKKAYAQKDLLIVDEAHYGSSGAKLDDSHKSFKIIFDSKKFRRQLYVTATPWDLNTEVYPGLLVSQQDKMVVLKNRVSSLTMRQAHKLKLISDVMFCTIHSATTLKLKKIEDESEETIEADETEKLAKKVSKKKVNLRDERSLNSLRKAVTETVLSSVMKIESNDGKRELPPMIVFCRQIKDDPRSIHEAHKVVIRVGKQLFGRKWISGTETVAMCHSEVMDEKATVLLEKFARGEIRILLVAGMAQEGFNYPDLKVAVDLAPSLNNIRRRVQKIGRVCRNNGEMARYYYADTITNYVHSKGVKSELNSETRDKLERDIREHDKLGEAQAVVAAHANAAKSIMSIEQADTNDADPGATIQCFGTKKLEITVGEGLENEDIKLHNKSKKETVYCTETGFFISDAYTCENKVAGTIKTAKLSEILESKNNNVKWIKKDTTDLIAFFKSL